MPIRTYKDLVIWKKAIQLVKRIYQLTRAFPSDEKFGLVSQMRRAAVSVPSNIAEGQARATTGEFAQFLSHAGGSLAEVDTQLIISIELGYCVRPDAQDAFSLVEELQKMMAALRSKLLIRRSSLTTSH